MTSTLWDDASMNPTGWYMTEKFDGMRLYWNGSQFLTRHGNTVKVPDSLTRQMPSAPLDGELWYFVCCKYLILGLNMDCIKMQ
jgi:DNA ligase-1